MEVLIMGTVTQAGCDQGSPNPEFVSPDGYDLCTNCKTKTQYPWDTPVDARNCYTDGGQMCFVCYTEIYDEKNTLAIDDQEWM